jgi:DNA-binding NarL/FixJ family response regulator
MIYPDPRTLETESRPRLRLVPASPAAAASRTPSAAATTAPFGRPGAAADLLTDEELAARTGLTPRQAQVARMLVWRLTNREIGERLGLSESTVRRHVEGVFVRLGVAGRRAVGDAIAERIQVRTCRQREASSHAKE